jgi:CxxC motif-containing protein (DUF1111 family)
MPTLTTILVGSFALALVGCDGKESPVRAAQAGTDPAASLPSGPAANAYGHALTDLHREHWDDLRAGKAIFIATWVPAGGAEAERLARGPAAQVREGLGPLFNATSCQGCHFKDGRGRPPPDLRRSEETHDAAELSPAGPPRLLRIGLVGDQGQLLPEPSYGLQLQDRALPGHRPEGSFAALAVPQQGRYADGAPFHLEAPRPILQNVRGEPLHAEAALSLRLPPSLIGLGLLEAVTEAMIVELADPDDDDRDGISGRAARLSANALGRFGWKASQPSLRAQNAAALREDLGVSTSLAPEHACTAPVRADCAASMTPGTPELSDAELEQLTRYLRLLEPPVRRDVAAPPVQRGERLFSSLGCAKCHRPSLQTGDVADLPELSRRPIEPYSDLLLHDMGDGLADGRPEGGASGREWRTAPLWGLGLLAAVSGEVHLLHDGRARTVEEAILWHGGEAAAARENFRRAAAAERAALLAFLASL